MTPAALTPGRRWASALNSLATKANADPEADGDVKELLALIGKFDSLQQEKDAQANKAKEDVEAKFYQMIDQMNALNPDQAKRVAPPAKELFKGSGDLVSKQSLVEAGYEIISQLTAAAIAQPEYAHLRVFRLIRPGEAPALVERLAREAQD